MGSNTPYSGIGPEHGVTWSSERITGPRHREQSFQAGPEGQEEDLGKATTAPSIPSDCLGGTVFPRTMA